MLFEGINRIYRDYGVFDYPRSGGSRHNGMDIDGVNSFVIRMPSFNGKTISGTVTRSESLLTIVIPLGNGAIMLPLN